MEIKGRKTKLKADWGAIVLQLQRTTKVKKKRGKADGETGKCWNKGSGVLEREQVNVSHSLMTRWPETHKHTSQIPPCFLCSVACACVALWQCSQCWSYANIWYLTNTLNGHCAWISSTAIANVLHCATDCKYNTLKPWATAFSCKADAQIAYWEANRSAKVLK